MEELRRGGDKTGRWTPDASRKRIILILSETAVIFAILLVWIFSDSLKESTNLWVLFFYSFPSEFLVGLVPHEPVLIYYGIHYPAWVVAAVAIVSTVMAEGANYALFDLFYGMPAFKEASRGKVVRRIVDLFKRWPFTAIVLSGFTPVPFFPIRFLVVLGGYPVWKYLLGVFVSRAPRFYLLALFGGLVEIPTGLLTGLFVGMLAVVNIPALIKLFSAGFDGGNRG